MYRVITTSIRSSKVRQIMDDWKTPFLTVPEGYYLGTTSGHKYFGGGEGFVVGDALHAIVVDDSDFPLPVRTLSINERFERALYMMEQRSIVSVWSDGRCVVGR
jgi:guanine deaminase